MASDIWRALRAGPGAAQLQQQSARSIYGGPNANVQSQPGPSSFPGGDEQVTGRRRRGGGEDDDRDASRRGPAYAHLLQVAGPGREPYTRPLFSSATIHRRRHRSGAIAPEPTQGIPSVTIPLRTLPQVKLKPETSNVTWNVQPVT